MSKYPQKQTSINELVVDNLILKRAIQGRLVVTESFEVQKNAAFVKNVSIKENANISQNVYAENMYARNSIYTKDIIADGNLLLKGESAITYNNLNIGGNLILQDTLKFGQSNATISSSSQKNIGINTPTPESTLDIVGTNPCSLNVYTANITNLNIIARNNANRGITTFSNTITSHIGFYNNNMINNSTFNVFSQTPDAKIEYANSGTLSFNTPNSVDIYSRTHITTNPSKSNLSVFNETLSVHGNGSVVPYLWNYYENANTTTESVATFISGNSAINTFLNMVAPNKQGVAIGGGEYINDSTRSFGTLGLINSDGEYYPSLNIVSGNSRVKQKFTIGINTHSPKVDTYSVDINGPTQITNGEITPVYHSDFEILTMSFSKVDPLHGVAVGTPRNTVADQNNKFTYSILYTNTGGEYWYTGNLPTDIDIGGFTQYATFFSDSYVYDSNLSIIVGEYYSSYENKNILKSILLYSIDGGLNWYILKVLINYLQLEDIVKSVFIKNIDNNNKGVYLTTPSKILLLYSSYIKRPDNNKFIDVNIMNDNDVYDFQLNGLYDLLDDKYTTNPSNLRIKGHDNRLHLVYDNVIVSYNILSYNIPNLTIVTSPPHTIADNLKYNCISVYDDNHAVAVGNNIISYISSGNDWKDVPTEYNLNSVYMYNTNFSIAVGNGGTIVYSTDGNRTWNPISQPVLNTSGVSSLVSSDRLTHVARLNNNSFIITKNSIPYASGNVDAANTIGQKGDSSIYYCYLPNFFDNANNFVFDVFGSSRFTGDINVYNGGKINSTDDTFQLLNQDVNTIYFGNEATSISIGNVYNSTLTANYDLNVLNDSSLNGNVTIGGNAYIYKNLTVDQNAIVNKKLFVIDDASMIANLHVWNNTTVGNDLRVTGDSRLDSKLYVVDDVSISANLHVTGDSRLDSKLYVVDDVSMSGNLNVENTVQSFYYEGPIKGGDILIGSLKYDATVNGHKDGRTIYIGTPPTGTHTMKTTIILGGPGDTVYTYGNTVSVSDTQYGKILRLNQSGVNNGSSSGSGITFFDGDTTNEGEFLISSDSNGFYFKAPRSTNRVKFNVSQLTGENRILTLFAPIATEQAEGVNYVIKTSAVDYRNIMIKEYNLTDIDTNTQKINTNVGISEKLYVTKAMSVGINNNTQNTYNYSALHINGSTSQENGYIWQF